MPEQTALARKLRYEQTDAERVLWARLRNKRLEGVKFRRQQPVGPYIVDFISFEKKLIVEIDGGQHSEGTVRERDEERTKWLEEGGYRVLRFWNNEVLERVEGVLERIRDTLTLPSPLKGEGIDSPSPRGRELEGGGKETTTLTSALRSPILCSD